MAKYKSIIKTYQNLNEGDEIQSGDEKWNEREHTWFKMGVESIRHVSEYEVGHWRRLVSVTEYAHNELIPR